MAQDTRKDPRAKVLTMTVRYKSATLDEFIEHHSHDVSRGGMFIKTPSPFPPGTLLKFEVKIASDEKVMQGVGRVVWKREPSDSNEARPPGMGVKFIKIDDTSRGVIDQLVTKSGGGETAFDQGGGGGASVPPAAAAHAPAPVSKPPSVGGVKTPSIKPAIASPGIPAAPKAPVAAGSPAALKPVATAPTATSPRKVTMIGLGAMNAAAVEKAVAEATAKKEAEKPAENFFPKTDSEADQPPPEDRTVMKQAAELLQDALREAGGSMEEIGTPAKAEPKPAETKLEEEKTPIKQAAAAAIAPALAKAAESERPAAEAKEAVRPAAATREEPKPRAVRSVPAPAEDMAEEGGGSGKIVAILVAVAIAAGAIFLLTREKEQPAPPATTAAAPQPPEQVKPPEPTPPPTQAQAEPPPSAVPPPEPPPSAVTPAPVPEPPPSAAAPAPEPEPKKKPVVARPAPKPAAEPPPAGEEPAPKPAPKPVAPKPKPAPAPPAGDSDNPY